MRTVLVLAAVTLSAALQSISFEVAAQDAAAANGVWLTQSGNLEVAIAPCGPAWCGTVVRVLGNRSMSGPGAPMQAVDKRDPLGMQILTGLIPSDEREWQGRIYNRENGKSYDCRITALSPSRLEIRAYKFLPLFGRTQIWTRVAAEGTS